MVLNHHGKAIKAYVPNTGRMEEFCLPGRIFYLTKVPMPKYQYKVIGTIYQNQYVFLDTIKVNSVVHEILKAGSIGDFKGDFIIKREVPMANSRFDFLLQSAKGTDKVIEVKSCTLCHNGTAMFPDAPTIRGQRHLLDLEGLVSPDMKAHILYLIPNQSAQRFIPNFHTDFRYANIFKGLSKVKKSAWIPWFNDPITIDPTKIKAVKIDEKALNLNCNDSGSYLLLIHNDRDRKISVGRLGKIYFRKGYYIYTGSARHSLSKRIKRHQRITKKIHWHIDYILKEMKLLKTFSIIKKEREEIQLAERMLTIADDFIKGFGASDSSLISHLTYFKYSPMKSEYFITTLLDFRMNFNG